MSNTCCIYRMIKIDSYHDSTRNYLLISWLSVVVFIPLLSVYGRPLQYWVADTVGYTTAAWTITLGLVTCISLLLVYLKKNRMPVVSIHLLWFLAVFLILPFFLDRVEERLHFLTFGLYGALSMLLFTPQVAVILCLLLSGADELLQFYLVDRVGDWRDVGMNSLASLGACAFVWLSVVRRAPAVTMGRHL